MAADDIALLFASNDWKKYNPNVSDDIQELLKGLKYPECEEVERIELRRRNEQASMVLQESKKKHKDKMNELKERMQKIKSEEQELVNNLAKFNAFVKEKKLKVERAIKTEDEEKKLRENMAADIDNKELMVKELTLAKQFMETTTKKRTIFGDFLRTVVDCEEARNRYKDIRELMRRCETLVASRDNLLAQRDKIRKSVQKEQDAINHFKEEQNARILELSARLNETQEKYYGYEAKTLEKQRLIDNEEKDGINKQLTIANIRLSIITLWQYVFSRKIVLPGDRKVEEIYTKDKPPSLEEQLADVQAHIEDLHVVIDRVTEAVDMNMYNGPLCSEYSELRIDY